MSEENQEMNVLDTTQAINLMKHTIGLTEKYEKKRQFIPWRNYYDGQNDILDKLTEMGYMYKDISRLSGDVVYSVNVRGFQWLQSFVDTEILLSVASIRRLI